MASSIIPLTRLQRTVVALCVVLSVLPLTAVLLRVWAKRIARRVLDLSDVLIFAACSVLLGLFGGVVASIYCGGAGLPHGPGIKDDRFDAILLRKLGIVNVILWLFACCLCKLSILHLYYRVFKTLAIRIMVPVVAVLSVICVFIFIIPLFALNRPISTLVDGTGPDEVMEILDKISLCTDVTNLVLDFVVFSLPLPCLSKLQMSRQKRVGLVAVFAIGFMSCVVNLVRIVLMYLTSTDVLVGDFLNGVEPAVGIIAACIPMMRPTLRPSSYSEQGMTKHMSAGMQLWSRNAGRKIGGGVAARDHPSQLFLQALSPSRKTSRGSSGAHDDLALSQWEIDSPLQSIHRRDEKD